MISKIKKLLAKTILDHPMIMTIAFSIGISSILYLIGSMDQGAQGLACGPNRMCGCNGSNMC